MPEELPKSPEVKTTTKVATRSKTAVTVTLIAVTVVTALFFTLSGPTKFFAGGKSRSNSSSTNSGTVTLLWTAPARDPVMYDIRYSTSVITASNFPLATEVTNPPTPRAGGSAESYTVTGLKLNTNYYFALKSTNAAGRISPISNVISKKTPRR